MSEHHLPKLPEVLATLGPPKSPRRRHVLLLAGSMLLLLLAGVAGLCFWASSAGFERLIRKRTVDVLEQATGGRVEIASFRWHLADLAVEASGIVLHGTEDAGEAPYAQVDHMLVRMSVLGFWSPRIIVVRDVEISRPAVHFILYPDGSTNQPQPRKPVKQGKSRIDTLFDLQAGQITVRDGVLRFENRTAAFDFQNRFIPIDFDAHDVALRMSYVPAPLRVPGTPASSTLSTESYRVEAGAADLNLARGSAKPTRGYIQATVDLTRTAAYLRSLRISSRTHGLQDPALDISGTLEDFAHPHWQARALGDVDLKLLDPIFGYPFVPEGIAHLNLNGTGSGAQYRTDGTIHVEGGAYNGPGVLATGIRLDAHVHTDNRQLLVTNIVARPHQGGEIDGEFSLTPWLPVPALATVKQGGMASMRGPTNRNVLVRPPPNYFPVNGKVSLQVKGMTLDTLLDIVGQPPFQRLGLNGILSGSADAKWTNGDVDTLVVNSQLNLTPNSNAVAGEVATGGVVDGTYVQRDGAVALRALEIRTPSSTVQVHGHLGAYPLTSASGLVVDLHTTNLGDFDTVVRDLGWDRYGKSGAAALPVALAGQADFHGTWVGSLVNPRIGGTVKATQISLEMLPVQQKADAKATTPPQPVQPQFVHWDSIDATGGYAEDRVAIERALLRRGQAEIAVSGSLDAVPAKVPEFDSNSTLHLKVHVANVGMDDLLPLVGERWPVTGTLGAQFQADGPLHALDGSGWAELDSATVYGEPVNRLRVQGAVAGQQVKVSSLTVNAPAGAASASGSYDLKPREFHVDLTGSGIDVARVEAVRNRGLDLSGKLDMHVSGSGTLDDPRLQAHATFTSLVFSGESMGALDVVAHTANRAVTYDATTRLEAAELKLHGQTELNTDNTTQAKLEFSQFNIGALLKMTHLESLRGESALAGTITVEGPLARPVEMRGDAKLQSLAATIEGVHLRSEGGVHATLADGRVHLDPVHVTGDETDLRAQGTLGLKDKQQLDFAASGSINLKLAQTLDPDLTAGGTTTFQVEGHGPLSDPGLQGRIDFQNGSLSLEDVPNGLSQLHGTLEFNRNRLEVKSLTAMSGGGLLSVGGYLAYQHGLYADLQVTGKSIRIRYPQGVSSLADANLRLLGSQNSLLLSGGVLITRFTVSPDLDVATLTARANAVQTIAPPDAPSNHVRLDVHVESSPQLNFQNAFAKLAGNVDLRLRGTVASPSLLGRVSITEGTATIAGTRYDLQRGDIFFTNPVRIEPSIDLNATAHVDDYDITLGLHGTPPDKMSVNYRSDPPLPEADVVALLALGRTQNQERLYMAQQEQTVANPTTDVLLGGALNATVSSRVQKLFGAGSVKVDPNYLGALGNSTSRIIVEEQLGRNLTLMYATNVDTTGQQLIQAEVAINRHVSLLVARDESGVFSMVIKATRRYK